MKKEKIRSAEKEDIGRIIQLCKAHADYEQCDYDSEGKAERLEKYLFQERGVLECIVAEMDGEVVGYSTYMKQFSTWDASYYLYLDCIYLEEKVRGNGIGERMMKYVHERAKKESCIEVQWQTPDFNSRAISFYRRLGASSKSKERFFWQTK